MVNFAAFLVIRFAPFFTGVIVWIGAPSAATQGSSRCRAPSNATVCQRTFRSSLHPAEFCSARLLFIFLFRFCLEQQERKVCYFCACFYLERAEAGDRVIVRHGSSSRLHSSAINKTHSC